MRHNLEHVTIMDYNGRINENGIHFAGHGPLRVQESNCRGTGGKGVSGRVSQPYALGLGRCYRCKDVVEPLISKQWFVKVAPLAQAAMKAVQEGNTRIIPEHWTKVYYEWMNNIRDWCISRQIWWGHRIPAWTCEDCGEVIVAREDPTECPKCKGSTAGPGNRRAGYVVFIGALAVFHHGLA